MSAEKTRKKRTNVDGERFARFFFSYGVRVSRSTNEMESTAKQQQELVDSWICRGSEPASRSREGLAPTEGEEKIPFWLHAYGTRADRNPARPCEGKVAPLKKKEKKEEDEPFWMNAYGTRGSPSDSSGPAALRPSRDAAASVPETASPSKSKSKRKRKNKNLRKSNSSRKRNIFCDGGLPCKPCREHGRLMDGDFGPFNERTRKKHSKPCARRPSRFERQLEIVHPGRKNLSLQRLKEIRIKDFSGVHHIVFASYPPPDVSQ